MPCRRTLSLFLKSTHVGENKANFFSNYYWFHYSPRQVALF